MLSRLMISQEWQVFALLLCHIFPCSLVVISYGAITSRVAVWLGDCTPKLNGGTSFRPSTQLEPIGLLLFATTGVGWGTWFPMEPKNFKRPKVDSLFLLLVGTFTGIFFSGLALGCASFLYHRNATSVFSVIVILFFCDLSVLFLSFSLFQWIPFPYFGVFRYASPFFPSKLTEKILKYHKHLTLGFIVLLWSGLLQSSLHEIVFALLSPMCNLFDIPTSLVTNYFLPC